MEKDYLNDAWIVDCRSSQGNAEAEHESSEHFDHLEVTAFDEEGKEMIIPKCEKCKNFKAYFVGESAFAWICLQCGI